jgi:adenosylcobyric acid synthase
LFDDGVKIIEQRFNIPVLGLLPYKPFNLGFEDSMSLKNFTQDCSNSTKKIAVISYPYMSNYNDFEPLLANSDICVEFINSNISLETYDLVILPGSKLVIKDLIWLKKSGLFKQLQTTKVNLPGICGGYQMMFNNIIDNHLIEVSKPTKIEALGFIDDDIVFQKQKILKQKGELFEIHHGISKKYPLEYEKDNIKGTFNHGLFNDEEFNIYKKKTINEFVKEMSQYLDIEKLMKEISDL